MSQRAKRAVEEPHHLATPTRSPTRSRFITSSLRYSFTSRRLCSCHQRRGRAYSPARGLWVNSWRRPIYFLPFSLLLNRILFCVKFLFLYFLSSMKGKKHARKSVRSGNPAETDKGVANWNWCTGRRYCGRVICDQAFLSFPMQNLLVNKTVSFVIIVNK